MKNTRLPFSLSTIENQIVAILGIAFVVMLVGSVIYQISQHRNIVDEAKDDSAIHYIAMLGSLINHRTN